MMARPYMYNKQGWPRVEMLKQDVSRELTNVFSSSVVENKIFLVDATP